MPERRALGGSGGDHLRWVCTWCVTAIAAVTAAGSITSERAVAQDLRPPGPLSRYEVSAKNRDGQKVFDIRGAPKNSDTEGVFVSTGTVRFSPKLCESTYRLQFVYTTIRGSIAIKPFGVRVRRGRLDGVPKRCPFAGLPRRGLRSMSVRVSLNGNLLMHFIAWPSTRPGSPFDRLKVPTSVYRFGRTPGLARVRVRARYRSSRPHIVQFTADTNVALPRS